MPIGVYEPLYYAGQGILHLAKRKADGTIYPFRDVGNAPQVALAFEVDTREHKESRSGQRLVDKRTQAEKRARITITIDDFNKENRAIMSMGDEVAITGASVTNELYGGSGADAIIAGSIIFTKHPKLSAVTITDSAGTPVTLVLNTDYKINVLTGKITFLTATGTQPYKVNYTYASRKVTRMLAAAKAQYYALFEGVNTEDEDQPLLVHIYNIEFDPSRTFKLIGDEIQQWQLEGSALYDSVRAADAQLGGFGKTEYLSD